MLEAAITAGVNIAVGITMAAVITMAADPITSNLASFIANPFIAVPSIHLLTMADQDLAEHRSTSILDLVSIEGLVTADLGTEGFLA